MKIAIVGSREYSNLQEVWDYLDKMKLILNHFHLITGGARGVDKFAEKWAIEQNIPYTIIRPINVQDKFSYLLRNVEIISKSDLIIAFWDKSSSGTKFVIDYCKARNMSLIIKYSKIEDNFKF